MIPPSKILEMLFSVVFANNRHPPTAGMLQARFYLKKVDSAIPQCSNRTVGRPRLMSPTASGRRGTRKANPRYMAMGIHTLTFNTGSSTLKYSLYDVNRDPSTQKLQGVLLSNGVADKVAKPDVTLKMNGEEVSVPVGADHTACLAAITENLPVDLSQIGAVGHRVVHGGAVFSQPTLITPDVLEVVKQHSSLAPLHNPPGILGIHSAMSLLPDPPHVAVFDTAFHATMPPSSYHYAVPRKLYDDLKVRRYGFHGTSYKYVSERCAEYLDNPAPNLIILHLGSGASMCCVKGGISIDTTMGMTPAEGLVMGTRSGDIDPGILVYLMEQGGYSATEVDSILNKQSGILGLSRASNDFRALSAAAADGNADAKLAFDVFVERVRKYLGSYIVKLGGEVDAVVFTGGVGENAGDIRARVLEGLESLGIQLDTTKNALRSKGPTEISSIVSKTRILVVPTNEELSIALQSVEASGVLKEEEAKTPAVTSRTFSLPKTYTNASCRSLFVYSLEGTYNAYEELSLLQVFSSRLERCGYFRCIAAEDDFKISLMREHFGLDSEAEETMYGVTAEEAMDYIVHEETDQMYERILDKYIAYTKDKDFTLVSNTRFGSEDLNISARMTQALGIPAVLIADQGSEDELAMAKKEFDQQAADVAGVIVSGVRQRSSSFSIKEEEEEEKEEEEEVVVVKEDEETGKDASIAASAVVDFAAAAEQERRKLAEVGLDPIALLPYEGMLHKRNVAEVVKMLDATVLYGKDLTGSIVSKMKIFTVTVDNFLEMMDEFEGTLIVTHSTRTDVLMSLLLAMQSRNVPKISGILLTSYKGNDISPHVLNILDGLGRVNVPVIGSRQDTFETISTIKATPVFLTADSIEKISLTCSLVDQHLDERFIDMFIDDIEEDREEEAKERKETGGGDIGPKLFQHFMLGKARSLQKTIILPEGNDIRIVEAASILATRKLCKVLLLGTPSVVADHKTKLGVELDGVTHIDQDDLERFPQLEEMAEALYEARKEKGMTKLEARQLLLEDVNYFGTMMMYLDLADGMVSGAAHSTANTIRPALQVIKTSPGVSNVSSTFFMLLPHGVKCFGDCALNVEPTAEQLAEIAVSQAKIAIQFGMHPRVAMLSYATGDSNSGQLIDKVIRATEIARGTAEAEGFMDKELIEGPLQFDAAVDPAVAAIKLENSHVAGRANVLVYPDLTSGNTGYKSVQQTSKCIAVGPILLGLRKPVNDLSRGAKVKDIVNTAVITAIQSDL